MTNLVLAAITDNLKQDKEYRAIEQDVQKRKGTLCSPQGLTTGISLNTSGNRAYVGFGGTIDPDTGVRMFTDVVNAYITVPTGDYRAGLPVYVEFNRAEDKWLITGLDAVSIQASGSTVQRYNFSSPNNRYVDAGFIKDFLARPLLTTGTTTQLYVYSGQLAYNGVYYRWTGGRVEMSSYVTSAGTHAIAQLWYDPQGDTIQVTTSTEIDENTEFSDSDYNEAYQAGQADWLSLETYEVTDSTDTSITLDNLRRDNRFIYAILGDTGKDGFPSAVLDADYDFLIDANGDVVHGVTR